MVPTSSPFIHWSWLPSVTLRNDDGLNIVVAASIEKRLLRPSSCGIGACFGPTSFTSTVFQNERESAFGRRRIRSSTTTTSTTTSTTSLTTMAFSSSLALGLSAWRTIGVSSGLNNYLHSWFMVRWKKRAWPFEWAFKSPWSLVLPTLAKWRPNLEYLAFRTDLLIVRLKWKKNVLFWNFGNPQVVNFFLQMMLEIWMKSCQFFN